MNIIFTIFKMAGIIIAGLVILFLISGFLFLQFYPSFGGKPSDQQKKQYQQAVNYSDGKFINPVETNMSFSLGDMVSLSRQFIKGNPKGKPAKALPVLKIDSAEITKNQDSITRLTWLGHSAFLLEIAGKKILIDPMLGPSPAPHPWFGSNRFMGGLPITAEELPEIDAVIISHDHYDHLDYPSILKLKDKVGQFYVPLGVGPHLEAWGVPAENIHELNWSDEVAHDNLTFTCTPARHFSGRGVFDRYKTLWASWIIQSPNKKLYFSGDSGYGPHFKEIGKKYGPFDFAMLECGQYNKLWEDIHMMPEQTAQAALDVNAEIMMPIHWGAFKLALHSWDDPVVRVTKAAETLNIPITTPKIGEPIILDEAVFPKTRWWEGY